MEMEKKRSMDGYVLPVAMAVIAVLTFTMLGISETANLQEKQASNEQQRLRVEQAARTELDSLYQTVETNPDWLRNPVANRSLTPVLFPDGCDSTADNDAICQRPRLLYNSANDFDMPSDLRAKLPQTKFTGRRFQLSSQAEQPATSAESDMTMELSYVNLELWLRRDIPETMGTNPSRQLLSAYLGYYIPPWWEITVQEPWRFGCVAPGFTFNPLYLLGGGVWVALVHILTSGNILWFARCRVDYTDASGRRWKWESDDINPGDGRVFVVPQGSTNVNYYWRGVLPGRAAGHNGFWDWGIIKWWSIKQFDWTFPDPVDFCRVVSGTSESPRADTCPFSMIENQTPVNDPENPGGPLRHGHWR